MLMGISMIVKPIEGPPQTSSRKGQRILEQSDSEVTRRADDDLAEDNISKITDIIGGTVTRLYRLSNDARKSAKADRAREIERCRDDEKAKNAIAELRLDTECYIRSRFPMAPDSLRLALVEANAMRLRRLFYQRSYQSRMSLSVQNPQSTSAGPPPVPVTNATTARQSAARDLYVESTAGVPRARSALVNKKLPFPPIPPAHECPYCGVIIEFKSTEKSMLWQ